MGMVGIETADVEAMPFLIRKSGDRGFCVFTQGEDGEPKGDAHGCHPTEAEAKRQLAALYANVGEATEASKTPMDTYTITSGPAIKALGGGRFAGYLVTWGNEATKDADGEWFTPETDFDTDFPARTSVYWHHGQDPAVGRQRLTHAQMDRDDFGIRVEGQLDVRNAKQAAIYRRVEAGEVGLSSGSLGHVTVPPRESPGGPIHQWPGIGHDCSLTPIPSDRRNIAFAVKSVPLPPVEELPAGPGEKRSLAEATERITEALEILVGDYRTHAVKAGRKLSAARRERLAHVRDLIDEMLSETEPREEEPGDESAPPPVTGEGAPVQAASRPLPDMHELFATVLNRESPGLFATGG